MSSYPRSRAGFSMLEVLLAIALLALLGGALISVGSNLITVQPVTVDDVFWKAVTETRKAALKAEREMRLKYDAEKKSFRVIDGITPTRLAADGFSREEVVVKEFPVTKADRLTVDFHAATKGGRAILVGGVMIESEPVPFVTFYPDGTCSAFRLQLVRDGAARVLEVDPWTCAAVLKADANAALP
jgi:prepilin-type N-terminal cleavage/methylation domain-containing protein